MGRGFLEGIRVIECTSVWAGPWAGCLLADMGAEVIKVESKKALDTNRVGLSPEYDNNGFNCYNRGGIKSVTINMKTPEGQQMIKDLVKDADIFLENNAPTVMPKYGLDYAALSEVNPGIIYASLSGLGHSGPNSSYVAYASALGAVGGLNGVFGYNDGEPMYGAIYVADPLTSSYSIAGVLAALIRREKTGKGEYIDMSGVEGVAAAIPETTIDYSMNNVVRGPMGNRDEMMAPYGVYQCKGDDRWIAIEVTNDDEWKSMVEVMGSPEWAKDEKWDAQESRWKNQDELNKLIGEWTKDHKAYDLMHKLQKAGVAAGPSLDMEELIEDEHCKERKIFVTHEHPVSGPVISMRAPWTSSMAQENGPAPLLGQHNDYVFKDLLHMTDSQIAELTEKQVIF